MNLSLKTNLFTVSQLSKEVSVVYVYKVSASSIVQHSIQRLTMIDYDYNWANFCTRATLNAFPLLTYLFCIL